MFEYWSKMVYVGVLWNLPFKLLDLWRPEKMVFVSNLRKLKDVIGITHKSIVQE